MNMFYTLERIAFLTVGLVGGAAVSISLIVSSATSSPEGLTQSVNLFENVLYEIDRGYVDKVDDKKLFETVSRMKCSGIS